MAWQAAPGRYGRSSPIVPMLAKTVQKFPPGRPGTWVYEPKPDWFPL